jgi:GntR family transcriptional regulator, rspAB operon transcriptional repressor
MNKYPVQRKTLANDVYKHLYTMIITLKYKPGDMIYETAIADELGLSRTPVREAIHLLAAEGFVQVIPQKGTLVSYISKRKVQEAFQVRESLEGIAFQEAARRWDASLLQTKRLKADVAYILDEQRAASEKQDVDSFYQHDEMFHDKILEMCGNQTLSAIVRQVRGHVNRIRYLEFFESRDMERIIHDHEELMGLIEQNDTNGVVVRLKQHLGKAFHHYDEIMKKYADYFVAQAE